MRMTVDEARAEGQRYLDYLKRQEDRALALQKLAADRRAGKVSNAEKDRRLAEINGPGVTVYDGGNLADAIRTLMQATGDMT